MATITTLHEVEQYLPAQEELSNDDILVIMEGAHEDFLDRAGTKPVSASDPRDVLIETLLAAVHVRDRLEELDPTEMGNTAAYLDRALILIEAKVGEPTPTVALAGMPVGPGGREGEDAAQYPIFGAPRPSRDNYSGKTDDSNLGRPGRWSG